MEIAGVVVFLNNWSGCCIGTQVATGHRTMHDCKSDNAKKLNACRFAGARRWIATCLLACIAFAESHATTLTWSGAAGDSNLGTALNWNPAQAPVSGDTLIFTGTNSLAPQLASNFTVTSITFNSAASAFTLAGSGTYTINGGVTNSSAATETVNNAIKLGAAQTWSATSGNLIFGGSVNNNGFLLTVGGGFNTTISGSISGAGGLTKSGVGTLTLSGSNSYAGTTTLSAGTLAIGNDSAAGTGTLSLGVATIQASGGAHTLANTISFAGNAIFSGSDDLTFTGAATLTKSRTLTFNNTGTLAFGGVIGQSGANKKLTKTGAGTLVLNNANTFSGGLAINAGTVVFGNNAGAGTGTLTIGNSTIQAGGTARTIGNSVTFGGNATFSGTNDLTFSGATTLTGTRTLTVSNTNTTFSDVISGTFGITKSGAGTLIFSGALANTFSGTLAVNDGTLIFNKAAGNAYGGTALIIGDATGLVGSAVVQLNAANQIPDAAAITIRPDGQLSLQGFTEAVGAVSMSGGGISGTSASRLDLGGDVTISAANTDTASVTAGLGLNANRTFTVNDNSVAGDIDLTISGAITNGGTTSALTKAGAGTLLLNGSNSYGGGTNIVNGTLLVDGSSAAGTGAINLGDTTGTSSATLSFNTNSGRTIPNAITARAGTSGTLTLGALNASGTNTFGGTVTLNKNVILSVAAGGELDLNGLISGSGFGFTKIGGGIVKFGTSDSFTGLTTINAGTLAWGVSNGFGGSATIDGASAVLDLGSSHTGTVGTVILDNGGSIIGAGSALTSTAAFDLRSGSVSVNLAGSVGLTKSTSATVVLSGADSYTGATAINVGTLQLGAVNAVPSASAVSVAGGATFDLNSFADTIGSLAGAGSVTLGSATLTAGGDNSSTTFSGAIGGAGGLTKSGTGTLTLSGTNTYTGATTINAGAIRLGVSNSIAPSSSVAVTLAAGSTFDLNGFAQTVGSLSGAGNVTLGNGTLIAGGNSSSTTFSGVMSGSGGLVKSGTGTLTFTGANTFSGSVAINSGGVTLSGTGGAAVSASGFSIGNGTTLTLDNSAGANANRVGNSAAITLNGGTLLFISGTSGATETVGALIPAGGASSVAITHSGTGATATSLTFSSLGSVGSGATVNFSATGGTLGSGTGGPHVYLTGQPQGLIGGWATVGSNFAEYYADGVRAFSSYYTGSVGINVNDSTKIVLLSGSSASTAYTLTNAGTTTDYGLSLTDIVTVDLGAASTRTLNLLAGGLIKSTATATTISGLGRLTVGGTAAGTLSVSVDAGHTLTISAPIINNAGPNGSYGDADDGVVTLSKADAGLLVLSGTSTFSGDAFLNAGTVQISAEANLGASGNDVNFGGGTLSVTSGFTSGTGKVFNVTAGRSGILDIAAGQTLTVGNAGNLFTTGDTTATLYKNGLGLLVVQAANAAFDGVLQINAGAVELRDAQSLGDSVNRGQVVLASGTLKLRSDSATNFANGVTLTADSTIDVNSLTGTTGLTHTLGALSIGANTLTASGGNGASLTLGATTLTGSATFNPTTANLTLGAISGAFGFSKSGTGTLIVAGTSGYTGATAINSGTLRVGAANALPTTTAVNVASGAWLDLNNFNDTLGSLTGTGGVALGSGTLTIGSDNSATTFSGVASGAGSLAKSGTGTLTLSGTNTFTGATAINSGTLRLGAANAVASASAVSVASGAAFDLNSFNETIGSLAGAGGVLLGTGTLTAGGNNFPTTFSGAISGSGAFVKSGTGTLTLAGANSFTGAANVNAGVLLAQNSSAFGSTSLGTTVSAGAELQIDGGVFVGAEPLTLSGTGVSGAGALRGISGNTAWSGAITLAASATVGADAGTLTLSGSIGTNANTLTFSTTGDIRVDGVIGGSGALVKSGTGALTLTAANTFGGTMTINAGAVVPQNASAFGATGAGTTVASGAAIQLNNASGVSIGAEPLTLNGDGISGAGALDSIVGNNAWTGNLTLAANTTVAVDADILTLSGAIGESGGAQSLTKSGTGMLILAGANSYSGATRINAGTLQLGADERIADNSAVVVASGAVFDLNEFNETVGSIAGAGSITTGTVGANALTVGGDNTSTTFSGALSGSGAFVKSGTGTLTMSGSNTYGGNTNINAGALAIDSDTRLGVSGTLIFNGGTLRATGTFTSGRAIAMNAGGTIDTNGYTVVISGSISGSTALVKAGTGALKITGTNTGFNAATIVSAGLLIVNGDMGFSPVTIQGGGSAGGTGSVGGVIAQSGGTVAPGDGGTGRLNTGDFNLQSGAHLSIEIGGTTAGGASNGYDQVKVTGSVTLAGDLSGAVLNSFTFTPTLPANYVVGGSNTAAQKFFLIDNDGTDAVAGFFSNQVTTGNVFNGAAPTINLGGQEFAISYTGDVATNKTNGGNDVVLTAIPEPGTWTMLAGAFAMQFAVARFRRRSKNGGR